MKKSKKKRFISLYKHPRDKLITIELGKINASEMMYKYDEDKKDFVEIGYPQLLEVIRLPKAMNEDECNKWIKTQKDIIKRCEEYSKSSSKLEKTLTKIQKKERNARKLKNGERTKTRRTGKEKSGSKDKQTSTN